MPNLAHLSLEEAARRYGVKERVLTQLIEDGMLQTRTTSSGEIVVVADQNGNSQDPQTKEEIIAAKFAHLREQPISASEASRKYSKNHGVTISQPLISRWVKLGYITVLKRGIGCSWMRQRSPTAPTSLLTSTENMTVRCKK